MLAVVNLDQRVPEDHPLRAVKQLTDSVLRDLDPLFDEMYSAPSAFPIQLGVPRVPLVALDSRSLHIS